MNASLFAAQGLCTPTILTFLPSTSGNSWVESLLGAVSSGYKGIHPIVIVLRSIAGSPSQVMPLDEVIADRLPIDLDRIDRVRLANVQATFFFKGVLLVFSFLQGAVDKVRSLVLCIFTTMTEASELCYSLGVY